VVAVETPLTLHQVWQTIRAVELELGRERDRRWEARQIDLDILLYEQQRIWTPQLKVPHPRMCMRRFILIPAMDVAADWIDPVTGLSICELAKPLQSGPGSLCLVASDTETAQAWLKEVSELAAAELLPSGQPPSAQPPSVSGSRWLSLVSTAEFERQLRAPSPAADEPRPKLTVCLAEPSSDANTAWENQHLHLAQQLQLEGSPASNQDRWHCELPTWVGPRYLLPSHDGQWAIHEMVSALEAMDCPIEPIDW
ncbi:MAG: 2-amino-4-hydroxy-6-hydroxymethyldihydropteridine diphosphokinase, partial [Planctomycetales bacterium]|nr:2-amino-4-hydroxy-6-hydroxymethyldihydropteridine diphosphokinase [Planctomycetales bacterium]